MKVNMYPHPNPNMDGWYILDYRPNGAKGKRVRESVEGYEQAVIARAELEGKAPNAEVISFPRLKDVVGEYLAWSAKNHARGTHARKKNRLLNHIIPKLGDHRAKDLTQRVLDGYSQGMHQGSYRQDVIEVQALIAWMVKRRYADPLSFHPELPKYKPGIKHLPSAEDIKRFIAGLESERNRVICNMMLYTGLRWNEVTNLKWEDYRNGAILARTTKTNNPEIIAIPDACKEWFESHRSWEGYVFSATHGATPLKRFDQQLKKAFEASGVHMTPHMFRHASATFLYELTGDIYAVQHHLRHSKVTTSQVYARFSAARRKSSIDILSNMLDGVDKVDKKENKPTTRKR